MRISRDGYLDYFMPDGARYTRRQDVPQAYKREGTIFLTRTAVILEQRSFYGTRCVPMIVDPEESLNIDEPAEWAEAERRLKG
jgi:N-acylneuraminate cytidylyltransferase